jgi:hypothetical protein
MDRKPAGESTPEDARRERSRPAGTKAEAPERFGPLELLRDVKDDGRVLLVFQRAGE